jgi:ferrous iron transport protein A
VGIGTSADNGYLELYMVRMDMEKLSRCREGDNVKIIKLDGSGMIRKRLLDMGFMKGTVLTIVRYAPLKDPMEIALGDMHLSLRVSEAEGITVERI